MRKHRIAAFTLAIVSVVSLAATGVAVARAQISDHLFGKRVSRALEKAGVDRGRIDSILAQARERRPELVAAWHEGRSTLEALASLSPQQASEVDARVQDLFSLVDRSRGQFHAAVEELGQNLSAREKARLVLNLAERRARFGNVECGARAELLVERIEDHELLSPAELSVVQTQIEATVPELCELRDGLKAEVERLQKTLDRADVKDAEIESALAGLKKNREAAAEVRSEALRSVVAQLQPATVIELAGKGVRIQQAAEMLMGF